MSEKNKILTLSFLLVVLFIVSFFNLNESAKIERNIINITSHINNLKINNILIDEEITHNFKRQNYDQLNKLIKQFSKNWNNLSNEITAKFPKQENILLNMAQLDSLIKKKKQLTLRYESDKAILANSIFFLVRLEFTMEHNLDNIAQKYIEELNKLLRNISYYDVGLNEVEENIQKLISFTKDQNMSPYFDTKLVNTHLNILYEKSFRIKKIVSTIQSMKISQKLTALEKLFLEVVDRERITRKFTNVLIGIFYFLMLLGFLTLFLKTYNDKNKILQLQKINEEKNKEITKQIQLLDEYKRALDESAIVSKTDLNGKITYVNEKFCSLSGYTQEELLGKAHNIVRHPDMQKEIFYELWETIKAKKVFHGIIKNKKKNGDFYYVDSTILPILDIDDNATEYFAVRRDVTELVLAKEEALAAEKAKSAFLSTMSHELRTPLNAVIGFSQIILAKNDMPEETLRSFINKINISGKHLLNIVNNILDFSKIESGKMELHKEKLLLKELVIETLTLVENDMKKKHIAVTLSNIENINIYADKQLLKQVILNILSNAVKFSPQDSTISIAFSRSDTYDTLSICDQGIGLSEVQKKSIFKPFSQVKEHQNEAIKGTGLGLVISSKIIAMHNGTIEVQSEQNKGSCFNICLPALKD